MIFLLVDRRPFVENFDYGREPGDHRHRCSEAELGVPELVRGRLRPFGAILESGLATLVFLLADF